MYESARNTTVAVSVKAKAIHHAVVDIDVAAETTLDILLRSEKGNDVARGRRRGASEERWCFPRNASSRKRVCRPHCARTKGQAAGTDLGRGCREAAIVLPRACTNCATHARADFNFRLRFSSSRGVVGNRTRFLVGFIVGARIFTKPKLSQHKHTHFLCAHGACQLDSPRTKMRVRTLCYQ